VSINEAHRERQSTLTGPRDVVHLGGTRRGNGMVIIKYQDVKGQIDQG
jgi:hypothetical protein